MNAVLVVRVTDVNGLVYPHDAETMSDKVFGTKGDPVNLKSQMAACSFGKLNIMAGNPDSPLPSDIEIEEAPGVIEVDIGVSTCHQPFICVPVVEALHLMLITTDLS